MPPDGEQRQQQARARTAARSSRCRRAGRCGQSGSNRLRVGVRGRAQDGDRVHAQRVGLDVGEDQRQRAEHDREVLGHVPDVLDRPVRVVAEGRVAVGLELVLVVVAGMEHGSGREPRVAEQGGDGQHPADRRGDGAPQRRSRHRRPASGTGRRTRAAAVRSRRCPAAGPQGPASGRATTTARRRAARPTGPRPGRAGRPAARPRPRRSWRSPRRGARGTTCCRRPRPTTRPSRSRRSAS